MKNKNKFVASDVFRILILLFCIINVIALIFLLRKDAMAESKTVSITYDVPEEDASSQEADASSIAPVITIDESLIPSLSEDDMYELKDILIQAGALKAEDGQGNDISEQIQWSLKPVDDNPGTFDADFSVTNENRRSAGVTITVSTELTSPFLMLTDDSVTVPSGTDFSISPYVAIAIDLDGSDLIDRVASDGYVNGYSSGTYSTTVYVYSRIEDSMTRKTLTVTVQ